MATPKQIAANRRNSRKSTGPKTEEGKSRSRQNAFRHGLTAETVVTVFENADDYARFEETVTSGFDPQSAVESQLVLRVASLLWRLRRALAIESGLFQIQGRIIRARRSQRRKNNSDPLQPFRSLLENYQKEHGAWSSNDPAKDTVLLAQPSSVDPTLSFLRIVNVNGEVLEHLGRYETRLWRQLAQTLLLLSSIHQRRRASTRAHRKRMQWQIEDINGYGSRL